MNFTLLTTAIAAAAGSVAGFGLAWQLQGHQITKQELSHAQERIAIARANRAAAERVTSAIIVAQNNAAGRAVVLRRELDSAKSAAVGLRDEITTSMRAANTSHDACAIAARTSGELLAICADRYTELAGKAEGHVSDIRTLMEAWPK
jgi:uncharacterized protein YfiM (DUF2279 family)